jgi:hypothetical protein
MLYSVVCENEAQEENKTMNSPESPDPSYYRNSEPTEQDPDHQYATNTAATNPAGCALGYSGWGIGTRSCPEDICGLMGEVHELQDAVRGEKKR